MRAIIVSLSLLAVVLAYIVLSPSDKPTTMTSQKTMAEEKVGNKGKTTSPRSVRQKAGEADWAAVHAIAAEYAPQLAELERQRNEFKDVLDQFSPDEFGYADIQGDEFEPLGIDPNLEWLDKEEAVSKGVYNTEKAIRDMEREQWARMSEHLSPYELREYRMEHSQLARDMRPELEWFQPSKGEFVALYTYREKRADFLDEMFGGDRHLLWEAHQSAIDQRMVIQKEVMAGGSTPELLEEGRQRMAALEGKDVDFWRASFELQAEVRETLGDDRWSSIQHGPTVYGRKAKAAEDKLQRMERLYSNGQITRAELELAEFRSTLESSIDTSEEEIEKEMKWYREEVMGLPPATDQAAGD